MLREYTSKCRKNDEFDLLSHVFWSHGNKCADLPDTMKNAVLCHFVQGISLRFCRLFHGAFRAIRIKEIFVNSNLLTFSVLTKSGQNSQKYLGFSAIRRKRFHFMNFKF